MPFHSDILPYVNEIKDQTAAFWTAATAATTGVTARFIAHKQAKRG